MAVSQAQAGFRVRTDSTAAQGGTPVWTAAENTNVTLPAVQTFRIRFSVNSTGTTTATAAAFEIYVSRNAGAYAAVTTSTTYIQATDATAGASANNSAITTSLLSTHTGTFDGIGVYNDTGSTSSIAIPHGDYSEFEFGLKFTGSVVAGDTYAFKVYFGGAVLATYTNIPTITVGTVTQVQTAFRVRIDTTAAQGGTPVWLAAANTNANYQANQPLRIRFAISSTGTVAAASAAFQLYVSRNSGAYAALSSQTYVLGVDDTVGASANNSLITSSASIGGVGTFDGVGVYNDTGATSAVQIPAGDFAEFEFGLELNSDVAIGDTYAFEVYNNGVALTTYTNIPTITVVAPQIKYIGFAFNYFNGGPANITVNVPTGSLPGDIMIAFAATEDPAMTPPDATWNLIATVQNLSYGQHSTAWWRFLKSGDPTSFTFNGGSYPEVFLRTYRNVNPIKPIDPSSIQTIQGSSATFQIPASGTNAANGEVYLGMWDMNDGTSTPTYPNNFVNQAADNTQRWVISTDIAMGPAGSAFPSPSMSFSTSNLGEGIGCALMAGVPLTAQARMSNTPNTSTITATVPMAALLTSFKGILTGRVAPIYNARLKTNGLTTQRSQNNRSLSSGWTPLNLPEVKRWWSAGNFASITQSGGNVTSWADLAGSGKPLTPLTAEPSYISNSPNFSSSVGGAPVIRATSGNNGSLTGDLSDITGSATYGIFVSYYGNLAGPYGRIVSLEVPGQNLDFSTAGLGCITWDSSGTTQINCYYNSPTVVPIASTTVPIGNPSILAIIADGTNVTFWVNGVSLGSVSQASTALLSDAQLSIFNENTSYLGASYGDIRSIVVVAGSSAMSTGDRQLLEGYLNWDADPPGYGPLLPTGQPYKTYPPPSLLTVVALMAYSAMKSMGRAAAVGVTKLTANANTAQLGRGLLTGKTLLTAKSFAGAFSRLASYTGTTKLTAQMKGVVYGLANLPTGKTALSTVARFIQQSHSLLPTGKTSLTATGQVHQVGQGLIGGSTKLTTIGKSQQTGRSTVAGTTSLTAKGSTQTTGHAVATLIATLVSVSAAVGFRSSGRAVLTGKTGLSASLAANSQGRATMVLGQALRASTALIGRGTKAALTSQALLTAKGQSILTGHAMPIGKTALQARLIGQMQGRVLFVPGTIFMRAVGFMTGRGVATIGGKTTLTARGATHLGSSAKMTAMSDLVALMATTGFRLTSTTIMAPKALLKTVSKIAQFGRAKPTATANLYANGQTQLKNVLTLTGTTKLTANTNVGLVGKARITGATALVALSTIGRAGMLTSQTALTPIMHVVVNVSNWLRGMFHMGDFRVYQDSDKTVSHVIEGTPVYTSPVVRFLVAQAGNGTVMFQRDSVTNPTDVQITPMGSTYVVLGNILAADSVTWNLGPYYYEFRVDSAGQQLTVKSGIFMLYPTYIR